MERYLPSGHQLKLNNRSGVYTIVKTLGRGASTVAYDVRYEDGDGNISHSILKEYNPSYIDLNRDEKGHLLIADTDRSKFEKGLLKFETGYKRQLELRNIDSTSNQTPHLQGIYDANGTKYMDVARNVGNTYDNMENYTLCDKMKICLSVAKLIQYYHDAGYLCLDIKPDNILVLKETKEIIEFIDFDSFRLISEITFGCSLSYTKLWAAPEQINPYGWDKVSVRSDIYGIGELIFYSVFNRHSQVQEHRAFSLYPFEESAYAENISVQAQELLTDIFHNTLRSSVNNRYASVNELISPLTNLVEELEPSKNRIVGSKINPKDFFIGRDKEIAEIERLLSEDRILFLSGIGGIGKSEIAKHYCNLHKDEYQNILYFTYAGDVERMICRDDSVLITNLSRAKVESDHSYCMRKLSKIKELLDGNSLMIIDNVDVKMADIDHRETWASIMSLPCHILITTRLDEQDYKQIPIHELTDLNDLKAIFAHYCSYDSEQDKYVEEIIDSVDKHTLAIELLAKHTKAAFLSPLEMLDKLKTHGIGSFSQENVSLLKDGSSESAPVLNHIEKIFSMSHMTEGQCLLLLKLSFMPEGGVSEKTFNAYFQLTDHNDLNYLIQYGWVGVSNGMESNLVVHSLVKNVVVENTKQNPKLIDIFCNDAISAMEVWHSTDVDHREHVALSDAIALHILKYDINTKSAAVCITRYVDLFSNYGNYKLKTDIIQHAIQAHERLLPKDGYSAVIERAYQQYALKLLEIQKTDDVIRLSKDHLKKSERMKDYYISFGWLTILLYVDFKEIKKNTIIEYSIKSIINMIRMLFFSSRRLQRLGYDYFSPNLTIVLLDMAKMNENMLNDETLCWSNPKFSEIGIKNLKSSLKLRQKVEDNKTIDVYFNSTEIIIDEAKINILRREYSNAKKHLQEIVSMHIKEKLSTTLSLFRVHQLLGYIAMVEQDYSTAVDEFCLCLNINKKLNCNDYGIRVQLGRAYNELGNIECSELVNKTLLEETFVLEQEDRRNYYADALYNMGTLSYLKKDYRKAFNYLTDAFNEYSSCVSVSLFRLGCIGIARCYSKKSDILCKWNNRAEAEKLLKMSIEFYEMCLYENHPELQSCKSKLEEIKNNQLQQ